jgi:hypothetical protein
MKFHGFAHPRTNPIFRGDLGEWENYGMMDYFNTLEIANSQHYAKSKSSILIKLNYH